MRTQNLVSNVAPDPSFSSNQYLQQEPTQSRSDYNISAYGQSGWPVNPSEFYHFHIAPGCDKPNNLAYVQYLDIISQLHFLRILGFKQHRPRMVHIRLGHLLR